MGRVSALGSPAHGRWGITGRGDGLNGGGGRIGADAAVVARPASGI